MSAIEQYEPYTGGALGQGAEPFAGGTDLIPLMRSGVHAPSVLVDVKSSAGPAAGITSSDAGWRIGATTTLAAIEDHDGVPAVLRQAAASAATRQIRNRATLAGNLLQRSRCSYFRDPEISCWLRGGETCPAREGLHEHLSLETDGPCITTHPSDPAAALIACRATVTYEVDGETTTIAVDELLAPPSDEDRRLHRLPDGAVIVQIDVPDPGDSSTYRKAMDRAAWQFALVGVAAVRSGDDVVVVANGVAPTPLTLTSVAEALDSWSDESLDAAADAATDGLTALERNGYKLRLLRGLVRRSLDDLRAD